MTRPLLLAAIAVLLLPSAVATPLGLATQAVTAFHAFVVDPLVVDVDGTLTLVNADFSTHDLVADADGPADNAWCGRYTWRGCPLFASPLASLGEEVAVDGTDQLTPLQSYGFHCTLHPFMTGTLTAV